MASPTRILTVGSIPPEWGGPVAGGVATAHRGVLEMIVADPRFELIGVVPTKGVDHSLVPSSVRLFENPSADEYVELVDHVDAVLMNHVGHRYADLAEETRGTPTVAVIQSWNRHVEAVDKERNALRTQRNLDAMAGLVFVSDFSRQMGIDFGFTYRGRTFVVHNAVPNAYLDGGIERSRRGVLFVGTLNDRKRADLVIEACAALGVPLTIAGDGPNRSALEAQAAGLEVTFIGEASEGRVVELMAAAAALCVPSRSEGFPLVFVEAAASGTPIVGHGPSVGELSAVIGRSCGIGVPPNATRGDVMGAITSVLDTSWDHTGMRMATTAALSSQSVYTQYLDLLSEVAGSEH